MNGFSLTDFQQIYTKLLGSVEEKCDKRKAYQVICCTGKTILQDHFNDLWDDGEETPCDKTYQIYCMLEDLRVEDNEIDAIASRKITPEEILEVLPKDSAVNRDDLIEIVGEYTNEHGYIDIAKITADHRDLRDNIVYYLLPGWNGSHFLYFSPTESEIMNTTNGISEVEISTRTPFEEPKEDVVIGGPKKFHTIKRGYMAIHPAMLIINFTFQPLTSSKCEIVLELVENSDMPTGSFKNDVFAFICNEDNELIGITQFVLSGKRYSTGEFVMNDKCRLLVIGMGTTPKRRSTSQKRIELLDAGRKLSKRYKMSLMNIYEAFDADMDGLMNKKEHDMYTRATGDEELTDEEWQMLITQFDSRDDCLTMDGFIKLHQIEASVEDEHMADDMWTSLRRLGYDNELNCVQGCPYNIHVYHDDEIKIETDIHFIRKEDRELVLSNLYTLGTPQETVPLHPRMFTAEYFGLFIAKKNPELAGRKYRIIEHTNNVKVTHVIGKGVIHLEDCDSDWVMLATYSADSEDYEANLTLVEVVDSEPYAQTNGNH